LSKKSILQYNTKMENNLEIKKNKIPNVLITDLNVIYNQGKPNEVRSLEGINLEIMPQEYVIIFGPSGCGKSTLLYSIAGLQKPTSGTVLIDQENISSYSKKKTAWFHRRKIGMVFQAFYLIGSLSIIKNICLPKIFDGVKRKERRFLAKELLERFGISEQAKKFPSELSGGQKQRVSIARSLINDPDIILADEPVGNLDSKSSQIVMTILKELNERDKKTVVLVTHDPAHLPYGDKIVHMMDGKIIKIEIIRKKQEIREALPESFVLKEGGIEERGELIKEEYIPLNLRHLMRSFRGLTSNQISNLLVPFKAQQIFAHLFFSMTNDQIEKAIKKLEDFLYAKITIEDFTKELDMPLEKGGIGWDKRIAERFSENIKQITEQANSISFIERDKTAWEIADYLNIRLKLELDDERKKELATIVLDRLDNRIGKEEFQKLIDFSTKDNGLDFDKRTAVKIAKELEMLLLLRYSN